MQTRLTPGRSAVVGTAFLMGCACGAAANGARLLSLSGVPVSNKVVHPLLLGIGVVLILDALRRIRRPLSTLALAAFAVLALASIVTPPMAMSPRALPWSAAQAGGAGLYLLFAALLGYAFWRAFPTPQPAASATTIGGMAVATGCGCCMVTGALTGLAVTGGASPDIVLRIPTIYTTGLLIAAAGAFRLAGLRPVAWLAAGWIVTRYGPVLLRMTGDWMWQGVNLRFIPGYLVYLAGAGLALYGVALAFEAARARERLPVALGAPVPAPVK
ncbi:MAG TPA: hypothetical protein VNK92_06695 [Vicinamibacterales bacterium]|nr:hypothetical protein [Vicinamibacterales bacterium]